MRDPGRPAVRAVEGQRQHHEPALAAAGRRRPAPPVGGTGLAVLRRPQRAAGGWALVLRVLPVHDPGRRPRAGLRPRATAVQAQAAHHARRAVATDTPSRLRRPHPAAHPVRRRRSAAPARLPPSDPTIGGRTLTADRRHLQAPRRSHRRPALRLDSRPMVPTRHTALPGPRPAEAGCDRDRRHHHRPGQTRTAQIDRTPNRAQRGMSGRCVPLQAHGAAPLHQSRRSDAPYAWRRVAQPPGRRASTTHPPWRVRPALNCPPSVWMRSRSPTRPRPVPASGASPCAACRSRRARRDRARPRRR